MERSGDLDSGNGLFGPGSLVWIPCPKEVWRPGVVSEVDESQITVKVTTAVDELTLEEVSEEVRFKLPLEADPSAGGAGLHIRAAEQLSDYGVVTPDDLCELTHLHQPSILHAINSRFDLDKIYTFTGPILIAVNPYRRLDGFYSTEMIEKFRRSGSEGVPHVFNVANRAYSEACSRGRSQTILISGESGAGKTETTKFVLQFLTTVGASSGSDGPGPGDAGSSYVEDQIIQSNPLLEAFGNAQTLRNHNSSRFGKFIEVRLGGSGPKENSASAPLRIGSARINTYLLEKVRVCHQQPGERNFHIFYQLCSAAKRLRDSEPDGASSDGEARVYRFPSSRTESALGPEPLRPHAREQLLSDPLEIDLSHIRSEEQFRYLRGSSCQESDLEQFEKTLYAVRTMGISGGQLSGVFRVIKAVLFVGNISFQEQDGETAVRPGEGERDLEVAASLLSLPREALRRLLTYREIQLREGEVMKSLTLQEAEATRDALSKTLYSQVFDYVLHLVNAQISTGAGEAPGRSEGSAEALYCGILDIFGFECFPVNSFEQLCINFANERLQQIFNDYIFNIEQDLYLQEQIHWDPIDFPDNEDCVRLLQQQKPTLGVFPAIDEECFVPQGSNAGLLNKLVKEYGGKNGRFGVVKKNPSNFVIVHYAGPVSYCVDGFIDKNRDQLSHYSAKVLSESADPWLSELVKTRFSPEGGPEADASLRTKRTKTLGSSFRSQLNALVSTIRKTTPHFIRCIKPNGSNSPDEFDRASVSEQLRYGGVLQAVQVSRAGYPVRFPHLEFLLDYMILFSPCGRLPVGKSRPDYARRRAELFSPDASRPDSGRKALVTELMESLSASGLVSRGGGAAQWAVGLSRVFLKIEAFRDLEQLRVRVRDTASSRIQGFWRTVSLRKRFKRAVLAAVTLQRVWRGALARRGYLRMLRLRAAVTIQAALRGHFARQRLRRMQSRVRTIQARWRSYARRREAERERGASLIQATFRMHLQRRYFVRLSASVLRAQILWRGRLARRQFQRLREERSEFSQVFAKYQEALAEAQRLRGACSRLEDQYFKTLSERNALREERDLLARELSELRSRGQRAEALPEGRREDAGPAAEVLRRLLRLSSFPFSRLGLLEAVPEALFPRDSRSIVLNYQDRQVGLLFAGASTSGDKLLLGRFMEEAGAGPVDGSSLQVFTIELSSVPGAHVLAPQESLGPGGGSAAEAGLAGVRESGAGERWPLNIMSITSLETEESLRQTESFFPRTRVAVFVYDVAERGSFELLASAAGGRSVLEKALRSGCRVVLFGSLHRVLHESAPAEVGAEEVRRLACELDVVPVESDSISGLVSSIVGIVNARSHSGAAAPPRRREQADLPEEGLAENLAANSARGGRPGGGDLAAETPPEGPSLPRTEQPAALRQKQLANASLLSKFNDGIRAFGLRMPRFPAARPAPGGGEFLLPTLEIEEAADAGQVERQGGIGPVINIRDEHGSSVTHIVFCRDAPSEPHTMLLVARKNGVIHAYYCYKTRHEDGACGESGRGCLREWSGRVEEAYSRKAHNRAITSLALSPDESEFLSTSIDMTVRRFLTATGHAISLFSDNSPVLVGSYLPFLPSLFIVSSSKPLLRVVNVDVGVVQKIKTDSTIRALCFDSSGIYCFAACKEGRIYVLVNVAAKSSSRSSLETDFRFADKRGMQVCSRAITNMLYVHGASDCSGVRKPHAAGPGALSSLLPALVVNAADSTITVIDIRLQAPTGQIDVSGVPHVVLQVRLRVPNPHSLMPLRSCFSARGGLWVASAAEDSSVRVLQLSGDSCEKESSVLSGHSAPVISTAVNASSTLLASGDADGVVIIWRRFLRP
ncbi:myosin F [Cryptosporidium felis]|nr:myosin F [Cryptosporidium felis]